MEAPSQFSSEFVSKIGSNRNSVKDTTQSMIRTKNDTNMSERQKLKILQVGSMMSTRNVKQSLYDSKDNMSIDKRDMATKHMDQIFKNNTIVVPEQYINKKKQFKVHSKLPGPYLNKREETTLDYYDFKIDQQSALKSSMKNQHFLNQSGCSMTNIGDVPVQNCWTHTQTHVEQRKYRLQVHHMTQNGVNQIDSGMSILAQDYFKTARKFQQPIKSIMAKADDDCTIESKTLLQIKDRFKNDSIYYWSDKLKKEGQRAQLRVWRQEMKQLEDKRHNRVMYDRIGRGDKTLMQERDQAMNKVNFGSERRYSLISHNRQVQSIENQFKKLPNKHISISFDVAVQPQNLRKKFNSIAQDTNEYQNHNLRQQIKTGKLMLKKQMKKNEINLHPLQREQQLEELINNREMNTIMKDFEIPLQRQIEIEKIHREQLKFVDAKCPPLERQLADVSVNSKYPEIQDAERIISDIRSMSNESHSPQISPNRIFKTQIDVENLADQINDVKKLDNYIKEYKKDAYKLLEGATKHYQLMYQGAYDKMAAQLIKAKNQGQEESMDMSKLEEQYEQMLDQNAPNDNNLKNDMEHSSPDVLEKTLGMKKQQTSVHTKQIKSIQSPMQAERARVRSEKRDRLMLLDKLRKGEKNENLHHKNAIPIKTLMAQFGSKQLEKAETDPCKSKVDPSLIGSKVSIVMDILCHHNIKDINVSQSQHVIRHFNNFSLIWRHLKMACQENFKKRKDYQSEQEENIKQMYLSEELLTAMFSGSNQCAFVRTKVDVFHKCHEIDSIIYFILKGNVKAVDLTDRSIVYNKYKEQERFELNEQINYVRKFVIYTPTDEQNQIDQPNILADAAQAVQQQSQKQKNESSTNKQDNNLDQIRPAPIQIKSSKSNPSSQQPSANRQNIEQMKEMVKRAQPCLLKFVIDPLINLMIKHARIQKEQLIADLKRFNIFTSLDNRNFEQLASPYSTGLPRVIVQEYVPNELIVEEGSSSFDHLYLVVQGEVRKEKVLNLNKNKEEGAESAQPTVGTYTGLKQFKWPSLAEKIMCGIGDVKTYEHFGLDEMLHCCIAKDGQGEKGEKGKSLPAQCRYSAKGIEMVTRILKISCTDFLRFVPKRQVDKMLEKIRQDK